MSIGAPAVAEAAIGGEGVPAASKGKPPNKRQVTAKSDAVVMPEPR